MPLFIILFRYAPDDVTEIAVAESYIRLFPALVEREFILKMEWHLKFFFLSKLGCL